MIVTVRFPRTTHLSDTECLQMFKLAGIALRHMVFIDHDVDYEMVVTPGRATWKPAEGQTAEIPVQGLSWEEAQSE